jgi:hypothetical protein
MSTQQTDDEKCASLLALKQNIMKVMVLTEGAIQDYIVKITGKNLAYWNFKKIPIEYVQFKNTINDKLSIKIALDVIDTSKNPKEWFFPPDKCRPQIIKDHMKNVTDGLNIVLVNMIHEPLSVLNKLRPDLFNKYTKFIVNPQTITSVLYCGEIEKAREKNIDVDINTVETLVTKNKYQLGFVLGNKMTKCLGDKDNRHIDDKEDLPKLEGSDSEDSDSDSDSDDEDGDIISEIKSIDNDDTAAAVSSSSSSYLKRLLQTP